MNRIVLVKSICFVPFHLNKHLFSLSIRGFYFFSDFCSGYSRGTGFGSVFAKAQHVLAAETRIKPGLPLGCIDTCHVSDRAGNLFTKYIDHSVLCSALNPLHFQIVSPLIL